MKRPLTLSVADFHQMVAALCSRASTELVATQARLDALRTEQEPPG